jgi:septal ring factor EnvC (AmiA/AmiB activator)
VRAVQETKDYDLQIQREEAALEDLREKERQYLKKVEELKGKEQGVSGELQKVQRDLERTRREIRALRAKEKKARTEVQEIRLDLVETGSRWARARRERLRHVRAWHALTDRSDLGFLLSGRPLTKPGANRYSFTRIFAQDRHQTDSLGTVTLVLTEQEVVEKEKLSAITKERTSTERQETKIAREKREKVAQKKKIVDEKTAAEKKAREYAESARKLENVIAELERKRKEALAQKGQPVTPRGTHFVERNRGKLIWPASGKVVENFGEKIHPQYGTSTRNNGIEIGAALGAPVRAVAPGKVVYADRFPGYGRVILIDHQAGYYTLYGHLEKILSPVGRDVKEREQVATVGDTGSGNGPMLYFELRRAGKPVDPLDWLAR